MIEKRIKLLKKNNSILIDYIELLITENIKLQERIDKAIEYINNQIPNYGISGNLIKEILIGSDKND